MHNIQPWSPTDYDSPLHGCLTRPYGQQADTRLPEYSVVYIVTRLALDSSTKLRFHNRCACRGASIFSTGHFYETVSIVFALLQHVGQPDLSSHELL